jgi:hypothetical protein
VRRSGGEGTHSSYALARGELDRPRSERARPFALDRAFVPGLASPTVRITPRQRISNG